MRVLPSLSVPLPCQGKRGERVRFLRSLASAPGTRYPIGKRDRRVGWGGEQTNGQFRRGRAGCQRGGRQGARLGRVIAVEYEHIVVEQGFLFTRTLYIPTSAVARVEGATAKGPGGSTSTSAASARRRSARTTPSRRSEDYIGVPVEDARFAKLLPTATGGLDPARHTPDDFAAPSSYGDPYNGGDQPPTISCARVSPPFTAMRPITRPSSSRPRSPEGRMKKNEQRVAGVSHEPTRSPSLLRYSLLILRASVRSCLPGP